VVIEQDNEHLFNSSVCKGPDGYVMAYESNDPQYPAFTIKFAHSADLDSWEKLPAAGFGTDRYTACPAVRYADGYYYVLYLENRAPAHAFDTFITRSKDLINWERSRANPVLTAEGLDEGINASDPDIIELDGATYVYFSVGDQLTWMNAKRSRYPGPMGAFFAHWFAQPGIPDPGSMGAHRARTHAASISVQASSPPQRD